MYWSKRAIVETLNLFKTYSTLTFLAISNLLHFTDKDLLHKSDKIDKLRTIVDFPNDTFKQLYMLNENIVIDESLMKYIDRVSFRKFIINKLARVDVKIYKFSEPALDIVRNTKYILRR